MILVAYASKHGATEGIARHIADRLRERGEPAEARSVAQIEDLDGREAMVLGSAVYAGSWRKVAVEFGDAHAQELARIPVWLFSSGPLGDDADATEQPRQLAEIRERISPRAHRTFLGALERSKLSVGERMIVKAVKAPGGDYRNWDDITAWSDEIVEALSSDRTRPDDRSASPIHDEQARGLGGREPLTRRASLREIGASPVGGLTPDALPTGHGNAGLERGRGSGCRSLDDGS
jgi:menaquinone-dependent protoporphyrinogen oxidase